MARQKKKTMSLSRGIVNTQAQSSACKMSCNENKVSLGCIILVSGVNPTLFGKTMGFSNPRNIVM
jgi:hypothetical protein